MLSGADHSCLGPSNSWRGHLWLTNARTSVRGSGISSWVLIATLSVCRRRTRAGLIDHIEAALTQATFFTTLRRGRKSAEVEHGAVVAPMHLVVHKSAATTPQAFTERTAFTIATNDGETKATVLTAGRSIAVVVVIILAVEVGVSRVEEPGLARMHQWVVVVAVSGVDVLWRHRRPRHAWIGNIRGITLHRCFGAVGGEAVAVAVPIPGGRRFVVVVGVAIVVDPIAELGGLRIDRWITVVAIRAASADRGRCFPVAVLVDDRIGAVTGPLITDVIGAIVTIGAVDSGSSNASVGLGVARFNAVAGIAVVAITVLGAREGAIVVTAITVDIVFVVALFAKVRQAIATADNDAALAAALARGFTVQHTAITFHGKAWYGASIIGARLDTIALVVIEALRIFGAAEGASVGFAAIKRQVVAVVALLISTGVDVFVTTAAHSTRATNADHVATAGRAVVLAAAHIFTAVGVITTVGVVTAIRIVATVGVITAVHVGCAVPGRTVYANRGIVINHGGVVAAGDGERQEEQERKRISAHELNEIIPLANFPEPVPALADPGVFCWSF